MSSTHPAGPRRPQRVLHVVGARPNFMKTAPVMAAMRRRPDEFEQLLVHTGQHYDFEMSEVFFRDLEMPVPDRFLDVGSGSHAVQTARVMMAFEPVVEEWRPDWIVVVGDVNSTVACALVSAKLGVRVAHVEAGLRSRDRTMPEEVNRVLTDQIADLLFTPSPDADANLLREGVAADKIARVGNVMIDTLAAHLTAARGRGIVERLGLPRRRLRPGDAPPARQRGRRGEPARGDGRAARRSGAHPRGVPHPPADPAQPGRRDAARP